MCKLSFDYDSRGNERIASVDSLYRVRAIQDSDAESPREWCNVSTMVCSHRRYNLGDYETGEGLARDAVRNSRDYRDTWEESESGFFTFKGRRFDCFDLGEAVDIYRAMSLCSDIVTAPLYLFDHSGLAMSTGAFSCPWDSGQVGFAFVTLETIKKESGRWRTMAKGAVQWARRAIESEVESYDSYLRGNVFGYVVERASDWDSDLEPDEWQELDSCWGFYGPPDESGLAEEASSAIHYDREKRPAAIAEARASALATIADCVKQKAGLTGAALEAVKMSIAYEARLARLANIESRLLESASC